MMRTIEVLIVIIIISGAFVSASYFAVLPWPRQVSPVNLRLLSWTTLQALDSNNDLSRGAFATDGSAASTSTWAMLQTALSASLPPNVLYNLTVYDVNNEANGASLYVPQISVSNAQSLGITSDASSYLVASSNVTFDVTPQKIGETSGGGGITLYILNCSDANSWWTVGYTTNSLATDFYNLLSPYFVRTVMIQNTTELGQLLNGTVLEGAPVQNAVIINTNGEALPIPSGYYASNNVGYDSNQSSYARYLYTLGQRVLQYNWTWTSVVGYPVFYVSNTGLFTSASDQNGYGVYGMRQVSSQGLNAFLQGLDNQTYLYNTTWITGSPSGSLYLTSQAMDYCNYYGIYPSPYQTFTRALPTYVSSMYHMNVTTNVFNPTSDGWNPGSIYRHNLRLQNGTTVYQGGFLALGLTRTPDIRVTALGLLSDYKPRLFPANYDSAGNSRLVVLQLGLVGGV